MGLYDCRKPFLEEAHRPMHNVSVVVDRSMSGCQPRPVSNYAVSVPEDEKFNSMRRELDELKENIKNLKCKFDEMKHSNMNIVNRNFTEFSRKSFLGANRNRPVNFRY